MPGTYNILVWPDGTWIDEDDYSCHEDAWRGGDYCVVRVPFGTSDEYITKAAEIAVSTRRTK